MGKHARLSPSSAHRWLNCYGSVALNDQYPETSSIHADEGTAAHALAERALTYGKDARFFLDEVIAIGENRFIVDEDMAANVQVYLDYVRREGEGRQMLYEQSLPLTPLTGEEDAFGTADCVIIGDGELHIIDLKYGAGEKVSAFKNEQLMMYAAAAARFYQLLGTFHTFRVSVVQPRIDGIDSWPFSAIDLFEFATRTFEASASIIQGRSTLLIPGEKTCRWCKAKATCPALKAKAEQAIKQAFDNVELTPEDMLSDSMDLVDLVEDWSRAVRAEVERRLMAGQPVKGFKIVQGRLGARQWTNLDEVEKALLTMKFDEGVIYNKKLNSPTQLEKKLTKVDPEAWEALGSYITRKEGAPSVARENDPAPALPAVSNSFEVVS